jgi:cytidyltransferase-like protein
MKKFVVMSGGFHPFHAGHASLYQQAKEAFPDAIVLVCATNVQKDRPFPFTLKKKLAQLSGVPAKDFIEVSNQFTAQDPALANRIGDPNKAIVIYVRSDKDRNDFPMPWKLNPDGSVPMTKGSKNHPPRPISNYLLEYPGEGQPLDPVSKHAYMAYLKTIEFGPGITSATQIRKAWPTLNDKRKTAMVMSLYPAAQKNPKLAQNVVGMFDQVMGGQVDEGAEEALQYATQAHAGQTRSGGEPYITHPMRVADHIKQYEQSHDLDALISAAYLHDTIEDTDTTHEALHDLFGGLVASLVKELTSDPDQIKKVGKAQYLAHKMAAMSSYALVIKLADRLDNVKDITTARTPQWRQKYKNETEHILNYIEKTRALSGTHQKLISLIRDKLSELDNQPKSDSNLAESLDYLEEK